MNCNNLASSNKPIDTTIIPTGFIPFTESLILSLKDSIRLFNYVKQSSDLLLYRGSRDGFTAKAFHSKCNGKANTVTIIQTSNNYVFGGYTAAPWKSDGSYGNDPTAFIFSLRKNGILNYSKFMISDPSTAIWNNPETGPVFGSFIDTNLSDIFVGLDSKYWNAADFGSSYNTGSIGPHSSEAQNFLAGELTLWTLSEIEVYQIIR